MSIRLSKWAVLNSVSYQTAHKMFKAGKIPRAKQLQTGTIVVEEDPLTSCKVVDQNTKRSFTIQIDVDLNDSSLSGRDQKEIIDEINHLADLMKEKLGYSVIYKIWTP